MTQLKPKSSAIRSKTSVAVVQWVRKLHLYTGVLFAPAILFFAVTGLIQVFNLHKAGPATGYQPPALIQRLGALHKDQTFALPHKAEGGKHAKKHAAEGAGDGADPGEASPTHAPKPMGAAQALLKGFAAAVAAGMVVTTLFGLYMAYKFNRNLWLVCALLVAGVAVPLGLIAVSPV